MKFIVCINHFPLSGDVKVIEFTTIQENTKSYLDIEKSHESFEKIVNGGDFKGFFSGIYKESAVILKLRTSFKKNKIACNPFYDPEGYNKVHRIRIN